MRVLATLLPLLAGLSLVDAQGVDFDEVYAADPSMKSIKPTTTTTSHTNTASVISSIVSSLNAQHEATVVKTTTSKKATTTTKKTTTTSKNTTTTKKPTTTTKKTTTKKPTTTTKKTTKHTTTTKKPTTTKKTTTKKTTKKTTTTTKRKLAARATTSSSTSTAATTTTACVSATAQQILYSYVPSPDTGPQFMNDTTLVSQATANILPPGGYSTSFNTWWGAVQASGYLGFYQLDSYNTSACAAYCNANAACNAFNIYFQRTPTYYPTNTCKNPGGAASVSCALYANAVDISQTTNTGQYQADFLLVITGSNGYNYNTPPAAVTNYTGPTALNAGVDVTTIAGVNVVAGSGSSKTYNTTYCSALCQNYTITNRAKAVAAGSTSYSACNYFNTFNLTYNGVYQSMYCQYYTTSAVAGYSSSMYTQTPRGSAVTYNVTYSYGYALYPQDSGLTANTWAPAPTGSAAACSALGRAGTTLTDYNSIKYTLACGYDIQYANDIGNQAANDFYSCFNLCDNLSGCSGFAWFNSICYFKNLTGASRTPIASSGVDMAWQPLKYAGFSASTVAATITYTTSTTAWTGKSVTTTTIYGGDVTATVLVETPGSPTTTTAAFVTTKTDSGTASTISSTTKGASSGTVTIVYPTPPTTCANSAILVAGYTNTYSNAATTSGYTGFTPQAFKTLKPYATATASYLAEYNAAGQDAVIYGYSVSAANIVLDHVFYLFAGRGTGYYTFQLPVAQDIGFVWVGPNALSGWNRTNAAIAQAAGLSPPTVAFYLTFGTYTPVRVMWGNTDGTGSLQFNVWGPDGSIIMASTPNANSGSLSPDIVQFPCSTALGAKFPTFGAEQ